MDASFYALYRRGRFRSNGDGDQERMQQTERFGVAILALCLRHDEPFLRHFLKSVCESDNAPDLQNRAFRVLVDPSCTWADLLLESDDHVIVVECKVKDGLQSKQNPTKPEFTQKGGYGQLFTQRYSGRPLHYVTLQKHRLFSGVRTLLKIRCLSKTWNDLIRDASPGTWEADLYLSLGSLGFDDFQFMKTKKSVIGNHAFKAAEAMVILDNVARKFDLRTLPWQFDISEGNASSIGKEINEGRKTKIKELKSLVRSDGSAIAWFGYETYDGNTYLSVWFYCKDAKGAAAVQKRIADKELLSGSKISGEEYFVNVRLNASKSKGDQGWFVEILEPFFAQ